MTTTSSASTRSRDQPVLKLRTPADICEAVPFLLGFEPSSGLVVLSLRGQRQRLGLVARVDLLDDPGVADVLAQHLVRQLERDRADSAIVVAYAESTDPDPDPFVRALLSTCEKQEITVLEGLLVSNGRWTSYTCSGPCCPPGGSAVRDRLAEPGVYAATMIAEGRQVRPCRAAMIEDLAPATGLLAAAMLDRLGVELDRFVRVMGARPRDTAPGGGVRAVEVYAEQTMALVNEWVGRVASGETVSVDAAARMLAGLLDRGVRDRCLPGEYGRLAGDPAPVMGSDALALWRELVRRAVEPGTVAPVATLLAACAYLEHGDGALANIALDRALADDPTYVLAGYLRTFLDSGTPPSVLRGWITGDQEPEWEASA